MEEEGSVATSCMASVARFLVPGPGPSCAEFPAMCHDPLFTSSPATPVESSTTMSNTPDATLMGNLLTDMLSTDFPYTGSSRFSMPEILQFPASSSHQDQSSRITLLQILEESTETTSPYASLKLPILEEPCDQQKLVQACSSIQQTGSQVSPGPLRVTMQAPPPSTPPESSRSLLSVNAEVKATAATAELKACKVEPDSVPLLPQAPAVPNSSANSESSSDIKVHQAGATSAGGLSQSSSGTETPPQQQQRPKRKRIKSCKNSEEVESQRQTHIAVERNRRKQMNEHLNVLRSLMPGSYVQRGDQASIIGGAIEFVKELEQLLQCLQAQKRRRMYAEAFSPKPSPTVTSMLQQPPCPFSNPAGSTQAFESPGHGDSHSKFVNDNFYEPFKEIVAEVKSEVADIEVKMVGSCDAVVKILSQRRPGQLLKTISALENMCMSIVHTNITTIEQTVLYSFTVKLAMEPRLGVEEIAEEIQRLFHNSSSSSAVA